MNPEVIAIVMEIFLQIRGQLLAFGAGNAVRKVHKKSSEFFDLTSCTGKKSTFCAKREG